MSVIPSRWIWVTGALSLLTAGLGHASTPGVGQAPMAGKAVRAAPHPADEAPPGSGRVVLTCQVLADRSVGGCQVAHEAPAGHGLGDAALRMTRDIKIPRETFKPEMVGAEVDIPLRFSLDADAGDMPMGSDSSGH
jgi:hypothetical protein